MNNLLIQQSDNISDYDSDSDIYSNTDCENIEKKFLKSININD